MADDIGAALIGKLKGDSTITALVSRRVIEPPLKQGASLPAVTVSVESDETTGHMLGKSSYADAYVEIECYATTRNEANAVGKAVRLSLDRYEGTTGGVVILQVFAKRRDEDYEAPITGKGLGRFIDRREYFAVYRDENN